MSIVSVNEWDTFKNIFSQNGIGDLIRQEIKILRKLYYIEKSTNYNNKYHIALLKKYLSKFIYRLGDYKIYEEGEENICNECNKILHYDWCIKCYGNDSINMGVIRYKVEKTFENLFSERLWCFKKNLGDNKFNELSYEEKMEIFRRIWDLKIEYIQRENASITDYMYLLDMRPCEDRSPIEF